MVTGLFQFGAAGQRQNLPTGLFPDRQALALQSAKFLHNEAAGLSVFSAERVCCLALFRRGFRLLPEGELACASHRHVA